jgi:cobaltochelatase CobS
MLALSCARVIASRAPVLPAAPAVRVNAAPVAGLPATFELPPVNAAAAAPAAPVADVYEGRTPSGSVAPVAPDLTAPGMVNARSLFADCPQAVIDAIPANLRVYYAAHVDAPAIDPAYAFNASNLAQTLCAAACTPAFNTWCAGPRGTGKTEYVRQIAARMGRPFFRVNFNRSTDAEDILGSLGIAEGETRFVYGPVALAIQTPHAILLLDEPTYAAPAHIAALNPVLERDGAMVRMPRTGERLAVAEGIMIFAADNTAGSGSTSNEYMGRNPFGSDTLDRFGLFLAFDYMPPEMERRVVREMVRRACGIKPASAMVKDVCRLVGTARAKADLGELEGAPSLRRAVAFCVALVQGIEAKDAFTSCIVNAAPEDSQEALRQIYAATWAHDAAAAAAPANPFVAEGV